MIRGKCREEKLVPKQVSPTVEAARSIFGGTGSTALPAQFKASIGPSPFGTSREDDSCSKR